MALIGLLTLKAVLLVLVLVGDDLPEIGPIRRILAIPTAIGQAIRDSPVFSAVLLLLVAALVLAAVGLWGRRRWGWVLAMIVTGFFVVMDLWAFSEGRANHLWMLLNAVTVLYLNQSEVRESLVSGRRRGLDDDPAEPPG